MCSEIMASGSNRLFLTVLRTLVVIGFIAGITNSLPVQSTQDQAMIYLSQFGYLNPALRNPSSGSILSEDSWIKAISEFQSFAGLNVTGELDEETKKVMTLPRCGVKDRVGYGTTRSKRYALQGSRWKVKALTYKISKYPKKLQRSEVDKELARAFNVWSGYTDLTFTQKKTGQVHIDIRFEKGEHGDGDPFDGPGGTLAHAYFPVYGGDAHFDDSEYWTINSYRGTNLFQVAAHEFGHSLGLSHSDVKSALMAPFYRGYDPVFNLDSDDISGIQALYGKKTRKSPPAKVPSHDDDDDDEEDELNDSKNHRQTEAPNTFDSMLCSDPKVDAMFNSAEGITYVFKGEYYYRLTKDAVAAGYPKLIASGWPGLPGNIDAAFTYKNGKTYFFKGSQYWRYTGKRVDGDYPKDISEGFTGIPDNVDAALVWSGNGKIYFFKGSKFWRFDPSQRPPVKNSYPKPLSNWDGVPDNVDAALHYTNGYTYFFKGGAYYRFNDRMFAVDPADPAFPRSTAYWWFGCPNASKGTIGNAHLTNSEYDKDYLEDGGHNSDVSDLILDAADPNDGAVPERPQNDERVAGHPEKSSASFVMSTLTLILLSTLVTLRS